MPEISVVTFKRVEKEFRFDAEYYRPTFIEVEGVISNVPTAPLGRLLIDIKTSAFYGSISFYYKKEGGIPFIRVSDIEEPFLNLYDVVYLPTNIVENEKGLSVVTNEYLLMSKGGTTGNICFIPQDIKKICISRDVIGIKINEEEINKFFLLIFLISRYGKVQLLRGISRQTLPHLTLEIVKNVLVPVPSKDFQLHIEQLVKQAYEKRKLAEQKYQQAEELLYELLGISKGEIERLDAEKAYETNFKEVKKAFRFDAEYYHLKYYISDKIFKQIPSARLDSKEYFELKKGIEVGSDAYCDKNRGVLFLRVSNLSRDGLKLNPSDKYIFKGIYKKLRPKYEPKEGEVLFSKDGTIGTATVVDSDFPPSIISGGVVRIRIKKDFDPYYLAFVLNSILLELQVTREKTGTVIEHLRFSKLKEIRVPKLPLSQQQYVANPVREYFKLRKEARQLVQRAIREVEEAIEKCLKL